LTWIDINNNKHDLGFVFEKDGTNILENLSLLLSERGANIQSAGNTGRGNASG
jgi:hypothetical protein